MKKNLRHIPDQIRKRINAFALDDIVVACVKRLKAEDISRYAHLGLALNDGTVVLPAPAVPSARMGRYSATNVEGREVIRKDLPMTTSTRTWETPNWGDWSKGSHTHSVTRDVYQREFIPPKELELSVELLETRGDGQFTIKFAIDQVLSKQSPDLDAELLYNLNLLQESVGAVDVFPSAATLAEYTKTVQIDWEILPPGQVDEVIRRMLSGKRPVTPDQLKVMEERLQAMSRLKPTAYIAGTNGFLRYFGAQFADNIVAFENLTYGNAIYVMFEGWEVLSKRSRIDLLKGPRDGFERVEHRRGWRARLAAVLKAGRPK